MTTTSATKAPTQQPVITCLRQNCNKPSRKRSPYCSKYCTKRKHTPKREPKPSIPLVGDCVYCNASIPLTKTYCNTHCKRLHQIDCRTDQLHRCSFIRWVIRNCQRSETVQVVPTSYQEVQALHQLWKQRNHFNGYTVHADGSRSDERLYDLCHLSASYTPTHVGMLHANNLVIAPHDLNLRDGNRQSVHNGYSYQHSDLLPEWKLGSRKETSLSDHQRILSLIFDYSPAFKRYTTERLLKTSSAGLAYYVWRFNLPKPPAKVIEHNGSYHTQLTDGTLKLHKGFEQPAWTKQDVLNSEFLRTGHDVTLFGDLFTLTSKQVGLAFNHLMWTAQLTTDYDELDITEVFGDSFEDLTELTATVAEEWNYEEVW